ncbi:hypothetical protein [Pedobacter nutrimenti]|uniref:HEAT repeat protein n=1 Tax=Pedobacter nutrimenti TaxID=1241337 RepID=A0A318U6N0_9SPHI|nr:hypothetical protein [Pedobacter nutrimenti]PYF68963.1 hypothetical protein B0O44_111141 [Pedobacter nutrimenti]
MTKEELLYTIKSGMTKEKVVVLSALANRVNFPLNELINLAFEEKKEVAFRLAWILEHIFVEEPEKLNPHFAYFIERFPGQKNPSVMRHFAKIIALATSPKAKMKTKESLAAIDLEPLVETLFSWLIDERVPVAVKVHCMQALANLTVRYDWIKEELLETVKHLKETESYAFFARTKQIEKDLNKTRHAK